MKAIILRASVITALLILISALGAVPTLSRADRNKKENLDGSIQKKSSAVRHRPAPLSYRSPGGFHKLSVSDPALAAKIISTTSARIVGRFDSFTLIEVSEAALANLDSSDLERMELRDDMNLILLRAGQIDTTAPAPLIPEELRQKESRSNSLHLVQLFGPPTEEDLARLKSSAKIVSYIPNNAYLIWAAPEEIRRLRAIKQLIQWQEPLHPFFKLDPRIALASHDPIRVSITLVASPQSSVEQIKSACLKILMPEFQVADAIHIKAVFEPARLVEIARMNDVILIEPWPRIRLHDERANQIVAGDLQQEMVNNAIITRPARPGYSSFLNLHGFTSNFDFALDIADTGFDSGSDDPARTHPDFLDSQGRSRIAYLYDYTQDELLHTTPVLPWHDPTGHGTINASIAGGLSRGNQFIDSLGFQFGQGTAPFVRFGISKIFDDDGDFTSVVSIPDIVASAYRTGARVSTNSWGTCDLTFGFCNLYGTDSSIYDSLVRDADSFAPGNQGMTILFSAGNDGLDEPASIGIPGTAKNVITVGASEGFRPVNESGNNLVDGCNVRASGADNAMDIPEFSSGGFVQDGRVKPDLVAPGTHITGAASQDSFYAAAMSDDVTVCDKYFPAGQTLYALSSGTSHSTPLVAGGAALAFQWLRERLGADPSPAMVKALILNSTSYLNGTFGGDDLPGRRQGWGLLNLSRMFEETDRALYDQQHVFTQSGGAPFEITGFVSDPTKEFRVMLVWSDAPAAGLSNATMVNQLNLEVTIGGVLYNGNNFSGQYSVSGGGKDFINNVQGVRLPAGVTGPFVIRVRPTVIAGDGVPGNGIDADQDFALVVANGHESPAPVLAVAESDGISEGVEVRHPNDARDSSL
ncbi:MAG TPA: S8 family serine peptidase, partial [Blastocatellia bacterium]